MAETGSCSCCFSRFCWSIVARPVRVTLVSDQIDSNAITMEPTTLALHKRNESMSSRISLDCAKVAERRQQHTIYTLRHYPVLCQRETTQSQLDALVMKPASRTFFSTENPQAKTSLVDVSAGMLAVGLNKSRWLLLLSHSTRDGDSSIFG